MKKLLPLLLLFGLESAASAGGRLNDEDAFKITKAIATYRAPLIAYRKEMKK